MPADLTDFAAFAHRLADASGAAIMPHFRARLDVEDKGGKKGEKYDPVTIADQNAETAIRELIAADYPDHGILGEEHGHQTGTSPYSWVLDPIDGTRAFITGGPQWGTLIALNDGAAPVLGVLDQPFTGERWIGYGGRTELHARGTVTRLQTRACPTVKEAVISTTHPWGYFTEDEQAKFRKLDAAARMSRFGGDCYAYGLLAMGFMDAVIESALQPWDIQALIPIVEGAGGIVTSWAGGDAQDGGHVVASGDERLHAALLKLLA
ncbi:Histidinol-phosphatase [Alphaproteobacteria bacterium SO-S41]|nr:Histidinol-phosphatase [Alphaproteobacteria bacterium SO-S41]